MHGGDRGDDFTKPHTPTILYFRTSKGGLKIE